MSSSTVSIPKCDKDKHSTPCCHREVNFFSMVIVYRMEGGLLQTVVVSHM